MWKLLVSACIAAVAVIFLFLLVGHSVPDDLDERAGEALEYCREKGYSTEYCLLVDYGRHSGRVRFFLWDYEKGKPVLKSLCAHGYGKGSTARRPVFSNEPGSLCSSLGHYRVGNEKTMTTLKGRKTLLLYGKDRTNSNALHRGILIHPVSLPNFSIYPLMIPVKVYEILGRKIRPKSEGCVTIPFRTYSKLKEIKKTTDKPMMLWVYE